MKHTEVGRIWVGKKPDRFEDTWRPPLTGALALLTFLERTAGTPSMVRAHARPTALHWVVRVLLRRLASDSTSDVLELRHFSPKHVFVHPPHNRLQPFNAVPWLPGTRQLVRFSRKSHH